MLLVASSALIGTFLTEAQVPQALGHAITQVTDNKYVVLLLLNIAFLILGCFLHSAAAIILVIPIVMPMVNAVGIDPIHFGIILGTNVEMGLLTPPMAANLYVAARTNRVPSIDLLRHLGWFLLACAVVMALITYVPQLALWYRLF